MILSVPASDNHVIYPMVPRAFDGAGTKLAVSSSYQVDEEGIHLHWLGNEAESHHKLVLWAVDSHNQEVVCEINVVLQGDKTIHKFICFVTTQYSCTLFRSNIKGLLSKISLIWSGNLDLYYIFVCKSVL